MPRPDQQIIDRMPEMKEEKLFSFIRSGGSLKPLGYFAAKEMLRRVEEGAPINIRFLKAVLGKRKASTTKKIGVKIFDLENEIATLIIKKGLLDEETLFLIIDRAKEAIIEQAMNQYLNMKRIIPNHTLRALITRVPKFSMKEKLARKLLDQNPDQEDLSTIEDELEGSSLQDEAMRKHFKIGKKPEDFIWNIELTETVDSAEKIWQKGKKLGIVDKLSAHDFFDLAQNTESKKIQQDCMNRMWLKKKELTKEEIIFLIDNVGLITNEDPQKVRSWGKKELVARELTLEELEELERKEISLSQKIIILEKELELIDREIAEALEEIQRKNKKYGFISDWSRKRLTDREEKKKELERRIENAKAQLQDAIQASQGIELGEISTLQA